ncbi:hypothetical protein PPYR_02842 [Photinus pyralis]|uniref:N-terminal acetyltransferase B complex subunit MDM20 homolog n=2 Tax=Photinus pyralis TaxID=7054 RepID=A0A1Y1NI51_PHOPY|nr:phagocyte signaling-impaired protein [Photinus pyralis]KAB0791042.1 hypothetical protein PPYR_02842 [Photinus pyralis]
MASKVHVQDNSVVERRLRPIYEWLDSGNNKKALQECDKVLKKTPNLLCAKALKALSILRMGREAECVSILDSLIEDSPGDDATLQAMTLCYRELQQQEQICTLYENAIKLDPANEEFHTQLFMSYVRIGDFKLQQQSALNLYKLKPKNPYYCWAVMSVVQQATRGSGEFDSTKRGVLLSLAERMIDKLIAESKLDAEQEVQLYLMILELQDKLEEALQVLNGPLGDKLVCSSVNLYKLPYLTKLRKWSDVNLICKGILIESMDRWDIWKEYIASVFELMKADVVDEERREENHANGECELEYVDDTPEKAHEFICRLVENGDDNGYLLRGPYLARFELCSNLIRQGIDSGDLLGDVMELFIEYFRKFGHRSCCVSDLRIYLALLDGERRIELANRLIKDVGISSTSVPQTEQQMQRHLCSLQLSRLCSNHRNLSSDHLAALVTAFSLHYQHGYQTYGLNLLYTDQGPSDPYAILAAHILYDLSESTQSSKPIITALVLLENLLMKSPCSFNAKLLSLRLFHTIGAGIGAHQVYETLDLKHLQMDSLGYSHCARLPTTGLLTLTATLLDSTLKFFSSNYKDSSDHLTFCYKYGSFIKLNDFMDFREKLNNSFHYTMVAVDRIILNIVQCTSIDSLYNANILPKDNNIEWEKLRDNHDLSVYISWDPERIESTPEDAREIKDLFIQNVHFLKLRTHILWALSASVNIIKSHDSARNSCVDTLRGVQKDWADIYHKISTTKSVPIKQNLVTSPLPSRLHSHLDCRYFEILGQLFNLFVNISVEDTANCGAIVTDVQSNFKRLTGVVVDLVGQQRRSGDCYWKRRSVLETVVNAVEIISLSATICLLCNDLAKPPQNKRSKKKMDASTKCVLNDLASVIKNELNTIDSCLENWTLPDEFDLSDRLALLNLSANGQNSVIENIVNSHTTAVKELRTLLKAKLKMLSG